MSTVTGASQRMDELDWTAFQVRYFPEARRHDLKAIAAYGVYKSSRHPTREAKPAHATEAPANGATDTWEGEGGASSMDG